jgi:hypothetical protein
MTELGAMRTSRCVRKGPGAAGQLWITATRKRTFGDEDRLHEALRVAGADARDPEGANCVAGEIENSSGRAMSIQAHPQRVGQGMVSPTG